MTHLQWLLSTPRDQEDKWQVRAALTIQGLHRQLQAEVVPGVDHPVVAGGCDVEHEPALL